MPHFPNASGGWQRRGSRVSNIFSPTNAGARGRGSLVGAGAFVASDTLVRARALGVDPRQHLAGNDARGFFAVLDYLLVNGSTRTNVNDFRALLVGLE
ncbi:MAG: hypothetical protein IPP03_06800 [Dechloromonas sp.]|nr:hypothetical protein [Candidatus Dechloromonas phosphoritropha]MBP8787770.1 hypothetical protein [Azonexus sp.]MBP9226649.1 hypothetical protein [Azonexus sp.]